MFLLLWLLKKLQMYNYPLLTLRQKHTPLKDNKQIVEVVDGALVAVESEYVTKYEVIDDIVLAKGYIADAKENGSYAVIDADIELIVPEVEAEPEVEADKANPETGAADFVGAAVAMAVVSVAAAGALALKK